MRERGLKFLPVLLKKKFSPVAPNAGAWIEISSEMVITIDCTKSLLMRERRLKYDECRQGQEGG